MKDLHARKPIDKEAARVVSGGVHEDLKISPALHESDIPIPTRQLPPRHRNLAGTRAGRLTVIGYWGRNESTHSGTAARHRWVVRCDCGTYAIRREQKLKVSNPEDGCSRCKYIASLKGR